MSDINIGQLSEVINNKMDRDGHNVESPSAVIVETYHSGTDWYRVWSDGWCEQGGFSSAGTQISFLKPFLNTNIGLQVSPNGGTNSSSATTCNTYNLTTTGFYFTTASNVYSAFWEAKGYIS